MMPEISEVRPILESPASAVMGVCDRTGHAPQPPTLPARRGSVLHELAICRLHGGRPALPSSFASGTLHTPTRKPGENTSDPGGARTPFS